MTLHAAIEVVIRTFGRPMSTAAIASEVNRRGLYLRGDGSPLKGNQINARVSKYPELFSRVEGGISLVRGTGGSSPDASVVVRSASGVSVARPADPVGDDPQWPISGRPFQELCTMADLLANGLPRLPWLGNCGVYAVLLPVDYRQAFIDRPEVIGARNVISPWPFERLAAKWVSNTRVAYIGLAGRLSHRSLHKRLGDLLRHASGKTTDRGPHRGGEILWQLANYSSFSLVAFATEGPPIPRTVEAQLLSAFRAKHGVLPFANRQA